MERLKLILACIWEAIIAYTAPMCIGLIYMDITGHSKGYAYDLGSEADISVAIGCVELIIWLLLTVPCSIFVFRKMKAFGKKYVLITAGIMVALFFAFIALNGGWDMFLKSFGIF